MKNKLTILVVVLLAILMMSVASYSGIAADDEPISPMVSTVAFQPFMWFDFYIEDPGNNVELVIDEFPGTVFRYTQDWLFDILIATDADGEKPIILEATGPIRNVYLADLNGDGLPEFCVTTMFGSGFIDERIYVYDYYSEKKYELSDRFNHHFRLLMKDGELLATQRVAAYGEPIKTGRLALIDDELVIIDPDRQNHQGTVLYQPSSRPATVTLKNSADKEIASAETDENGSYTILVPTASAGESYTLVVTKPGYLSYTIKNFTINEGEDIEEIDVSQLAGDINGDGAVNSIDLTYLLSEFNRAPQQYPYADINGDGLVNSVDLTYLLAGFNKGAVVSSQ